MKTFQYKDSEVGVSNYTIGNIPDSMTHDCFCCNNKIKMSNAVLLINNSKHIPNVLLHEDCFKQWENKPEELCQDIESAYETYLKLQQVFK